MSKISRRKFVAEATALSVAYAGTSKLSEETAVVRKETSFNHSTKTKALLELLGISYPIVQAPTAGVVSSELTASVANAGALGALPLGWASPEQAIRSIKDIRDICSAPFFANFVLAFPPLALEATLESGVRIIQFSWGMPDDKMTKLIKEKQGILGIQVTSEESARTALALGADYLVCQGLEAGGHVHASMPLKRALDAVIGIAGSTPVLASGGISNGEKMHEYMQQGAAGVVMGSRFVATKESSAHDDYKMALVASRATDTVMTTCMNKGWNNATHRVLRNSTFTNWEAAGCPPEGSRPGETDVVASIGGDFPVERYSINSPGSYYQGDIEALASYAGTGVDSITDIRSAGKVVETVWQEYLNAYAATQP